MSLLAIIGDHGIQSATSHGPCQNAQLGMQYAKCEVQCNPDGSCTETLSTEVCCSHSNTFHNSFSVLVKGYRVSKWLIRATTKQMLTNYPISMIILLELVSITRFFFLRMEFVLAEKSVRSAVFVKILL